MSCHWLASPCTQAIIATYEASQDLSDSTLGRPAVQDDETNDDDVDDGASSSLRPSPSPSCLVRGHHHRHRRRLHRPSNARQPYIRSDLCFLVSGAPSASPMRAGPRPGSRCTSPPPHIHARDTSSTTRERERERLRARLRVPPRSTLPSRAPFSKSDHDLGGPHRHCCCCCCSCRSRLVSPPHVSHIGARPPPAPGQALCFSSPFSRPSSWALAVVTSISPFPAARRFRLCHRGAGICIRHVVGDFAVS